MRSMAAVYSVNCSEVGAARYTVLSGSTSGPVRCRPPRSDRKTDNFCAASFVRSSERMYNSLPSVVTTLSRPAPSTVPYTPKVEHRNAAVTAASAAAVTCAGDMPDFFESSSSIFCLSSLFLTSLILSICSHSPDTPLTGESFELLPALPDVSTITFRGA